MIEIPAEFAAGVVNQAGPSGRAWIDGLPGMVGSLCQRWSLVVDGAPMHGYLGLVVPVRRGSERRALKISWLNDSTAHEIAALQVWNGRGAARLLDTDPTLGALLLEWLDSRRSLRDIPASEAITIAGRLTRRLAVPAPGNIPSLALVAQELRESLPRRWDQLGHPMPRAVVDAARDLAGQLGPSAGALMVNYDLHYENVLAGEREPWLVIDPKVVAGDPEYGLAQLLWTRLEEMEQTGGLVRHFSALVESAELDLTLAHAWTLVRVVDYWLWGLSVGFTQDPARCEAIVARLGF